MSLRKGRKLARYPFVILRQRGFICSFRVAVFSLTPQHSLKDRLYIYKAHRIANSQRY